MARTTIKEYKQQVEELTEDNESLLESLKKANETLAEQLFKLALLGDGESLDKTRAFLDSLAS